MNKQIFQSIFNQSPIRKLVFENVRSIHLELNSGKFGVTVCSWKTLVDRPDMLAIYGYLDLLKSYFQRYKQHVTNSYLESSYGFKMMLFAIQHNRVEIIKYLVEELKLDLVPVDSVASKSHNDWMLIAARTGKLDVIRYLGALSDKWKYEQAFEQSPRSLNIDVIKYLNDKLDTLGVNNQLNFRSNSNVFDIAAIYGRIDIIEYLTVNCAKRIPWSRMHYNAIIHGHFDLLKYLMNRVDRYPLPEDGEDYFDYNNGVGYHALLDCAVRHDQMEMAHYLYDNGVTSCTEDCIEHAVENGDIEAVKWLLSVSGHECSSYCLELAVEYGNIEMIRWLRKNTTHSFRPDDMDVAAYVGNLEVIEYLYSQSIGCSGRAFSNAILSGSLKVLQWFIENYRHVYNSNLLLKSDAVKAGKLHIVRWLHENDLGGEISLYSLDMACQKGHIDVVQWAHQNTTLQFNSTAMVSAASSGHMKLLQWLHENRTESWSPSVMDNSIMFPEIVEWLHENRTEGCTVKALETSKSYGDLRMIDWLIINRKECLQS
ncbi:hypothetical protein PPL_03000 [Heterostelium album PN500]|uniref:Ankyrin repeat protein n=1 Tax=Heterostelium pallidum (strain ATCC 26659 / Pp 5 / PN500) TaxID=670386 RepID=D3B3N2_HETP5|nr:hypothetical protein PPL_03000 [Heterostelium album PN500]EFA83930.1 hypothetical protein PPL_03000 [Heterostelium album PN500]|eukprot:XP_020436047.1 hypothetical protein PPL_03000 [Heterostelium album PN500]